MGYTAQIKVENQTHRDIVGTILKNMGYRPYSEETIPNSGGKDNTRIK